MEERDLYWRRSEIYRRWLLQRVFTADSKDSITIMIFPIEVGKPNYRDAELPSVQHSNRYATKVSLLIISQAILYFKWLRLVEHGANDAST